MKRDLANLFAACAIVALTIGGVSVAIQFLPSTKAVEYIKPDIGGLKTQFHQTNGTEKEKINHEYVEARIATYACTKKGKTGIEILIENSDDFCANKGILVRATNKLLSQGLCTKTDLAMNRGWIRAPERGMFYFSIYCDDFNIKLYLDATSGVLYSIDMESGGALRRSA